MTIVDASLRFSDDLCFGFWLFRSAFKVTEGRDGLALQSSITVSLINSITRPRSA